MKDSTSERPYSFDRFLDETDWLWLAHKLRVQPQTIHYWRARQTYPKRDQMQRIRRLSKGLVTYEMIIDRPRRPRGPSTVTRTIIAANKKRKG